MDGMIFVFRSDSLVGQSEREVVYELQRGGPSDLLMVVNRFHGRPVDERIKRFVWDRLVPHLQGCLPYAGQDLAAHGIYFVDALTALKGRLTGDAAQVAASGLPALEQAINSQVGRRVQVRQAHFLTRAAHVAAALEEALSRLLTTVEDHTERWYAVHGMRALLVNVRTDLQKALPHV